MKKLQMYLLMLSLAACAIMDARQQNNQKSVRKVVAKPVAQPVVQELVEQDSHNVVVDERALRRGEQVVPSVDEKIEKNDDGSVTETVTTVQVEDDKVITTTETWTKYLKYAALGLGAMSAAGLGYYAYQDPDRLAHKFNQLNDWWNGSATQAAADGGDADQSIPEVGNEATPLDNNFEKLTDEQQAKLDAWNNLE